MQLFDQPIMRQLCNAEIHADTALQLQVLIISNIKMDKKNVIFMILTMA